MLVSPEALTVRWELLPADYVLPDDPVDNIAQPTLAAALTDSLAVAGRLSQTTATTTNYGICATVNDQTVVKAPDWSFIPQITVPRAAIERSYTPHLQGSVPAIVMEFLSETEGDEFSVRRSNPMGKWFFYERILRVPNYAIFEPKSGGLEVYALDSSGSYQSCTMNDDLRYWIPEMNLFLGVWQGDRQQRSGYWLRWWDESGTLLLWGSEQAEAERDRAEAEREQAEAERDRAEAERERADTERDRAAAERLRSQQLADRLRALGVDPDAV